MKYIFALVFMITACSPAFAEDSRPLMVTNNVSTLGFVDMAQKLERKDPDWVYWVKMKSVQKITKGWLGTTIETIYDVDVDGKAMSNPSTTNDHMKFSKTFDHLPAREEINQLVDEYHVLVRSSQNEVDWAKQRQEQRDAMQKEMEERMREEFEERLKQEKAELEKRLKEEQKKGKIGIGD